jgi:hypothetical protein
MRVVTEYRRRAEECYSLAVTAASDDHRKLITGMAETWEILARQREALLKKTPEKSILDELPWRWPTHLPPRPQNSN